MRYPVTLTSDDNGTILVRFPDVPEAITYGETREDALAQAPHALLTMFDAFMKDRRDIPAPSSTKGRPSIEVPSLETAKIGLYQAMRAAKVNKSELARRLNWHLPQVDRVLNVRHGSQLDQIESALGALGKRLTIGVEDLERRAQPPRHLAKGGKGRRGATSKPKRSRRAA